MLMGAVRVPENCPRSLSLSKRFLATPQFRPGFLFPGIALLGFLKGAFELSIQLAFPEDGFGLKTTGHAAGCRALFFFAHAIMCE